MGRYYDIQIFPAGTTNTSGTTPTKEYTSYPKINGIAQNDPGALDVVIDAYVNTFATPQGLTALQIKGVSIADLAQASNLNKCVILIFAGFQAGFPLNNPNQAGLIIKGTIFQSFGNWIGTEMSLDLVIAPDGAIASQDTNISFIWTAGTSLASALATSFKTAFPSAKQNININPKLIITHTETGSYQSMPAFAQFLKPYTATIIGGTYGGVDIVWTPTQINVFDQSTPTSPVQIAFTELIGQPIWIGPYTLQFVCPMRADLTVSSYIKMPQGLLGNPNNPTGAPGAVTTTAASQPQARQASIFNGTFHIILVHHMGIFRQPDGMAWVTVFDAVLPATAIPASAMVPETLATGP